MSPSRRGFTLVEMLVVLGIIAVLAGLLLPAVMMAVNASRRAAIATEISSLNTAVEAYKTKHLEYPPNFRSYDTFIRHVRKCYPRIDARHLNNVINAVWGPVNPPYNSSTNVPPVTAIPNVDEGESLVFWLYLVDNDAREPFKALLSTTPLLAASSPEKLFPFKEERLIDTTNDADVLPSYKALYSGETFYIYIDSRSYDYFVSDYTAPAMTAYAEDPSLGFTRPYWSETKANTNTALPLYQQLKKMNHTTFQVICAGLDGEFGADPPMPPAPERPVKYFPSGGNYDLSGADNDNQTNFSEGRRLEDHIQ